jgi:hypothetical protein
MVTQQGKQYFTNTGKFLTGWISIARTKNSRITWQKLLINGWIIINVKSLDN